MNLYILRHAIAADLGSEGIESDRDRPLTDKGVRRLRKEVAGMKALDLYFDLILSSPFVRARETAEIVAKTFRITKRLENCDALASGGSVRRVIEFVNNLESRPGELLLVGHEPDLSHLISLLVFGHVQAGITLKKGGLCKLSVEDLRAGRCATLEWLLTPKQLVLLSNGEC